MVLDELDRVERKAKKAEEEEKWEKRLYVHKRHMAHMYLIHENT